MPGLPLHPSAGIAGLSQDLSCHSSIFFIRIATTWTITIYELDVTTSKACVDIDCLDRTHKLR